MQGSYWSAGQLSAIPLRVEKTLYQSWVHKVQLRSAKPLTKGHLFAPNFGNKLKLPVVLK